MKKTNMKNKGLSTIITTLIIVTASVVLGTAVVLFASGIFSSTVEEEAITVTGLELWGNTTTNSQLAFIAKNTGSKELAIDTIKVRGTATASTSWYTFDVSTNATITTQTLLEYQGGTDPDLTSITMAGDSHTFAVATGPLSISPGEALVIYVKAPSNVDSSDAGLDITIDISSREATSVHRATVSSP